MKLVVCRQIFEKFSNIKVQENTYSKSRIVPCGRTNRQTGMTKLIVTFRSFVNAPEQYSQKDLRVN
jgi:hypothetical protein